MSAPAATPPAGVTTPPAATPPAATPPAATPPVAAPPPVATTPPATPPAASPPPPAVSPPPPAASPPPPAASPPPPVASPPPPVASPPPPVASPPPPVASPPPPVVATTPPAVPPVATPPVATPPVAPPPVATPPVAPPPVATPPVVSPPPPVATAPVVSPPPPVATAPVVSPPPPVATPPTTAPPPPVSSPPPPPPDSPSPPPPDSPHPPSSPPPYTSPLAPPPPSSPPPPKAVSHPPPPPRNGTSVVGKSSSGGGGIGTPTIIGIAAGGAVVLFLVGLVWFLIAKKRPKKELNYAHRVGHASAGGGLGASAASDGVASLGGRTEYLDSGEMKHPRASPGYSSEIMGAAAGGKVPPPPQSNPSSGGTRPWFTYEELSAATNGFSQANLLGEGGFGRVYKGFIAGNQPVAVKQLTIGGGQGEREFRAEVEIISRVHHRHLVSLVGYCIADSQRLLVYDFVPNGPLDNALHGPGRPVMDWGTRMKIALGSARGLAYLHEDCHPRIIHRDIKASNILLDNQWEAQVADFGLAKLANDTHSHVTTRVMGTFGYLAPEYALSGKLTDKSDVYSFGVVLLELITGKKPVDAMAVAGEESLVEWARPVLTQALEDGVVDTLADPNLMDMYNEKEMFRMMEAAAACVRHSAQKRPKMALVVRALETEGADLNQGVKPGYSTMFSGGDSSEFDSSQYRANLKKFRQVAYGTSTTQYSSDYSAGTTSDYGAAQSASSSEYGNSSREQPAAVPPPLYPRGPHTSAQDSPSSGDRSSDDVRLDVGDERSPTGTGLSPRGFSGVGTTSRKQPPAVGTLPLPPNRRPIAAGMSVRSPRGGESVRSRSPTSQKFGHPRRGSGASTGGGSSSGTGIVNRLGSLASSVFHGDSNSSSEKPPPPSVDYNSLQYSGEFPESKYSTEDEGPKAAIIADRLEEGSKPLLSSHHKAKTVKFDFDGR